MAEFVNVHGQPMAVTVKAVVLGLCPEAAHEQHATRDKISGEVSDFHTVKGTPEWPDQEMVWRPTIGSGATEEAAWRSALTHLQAQQEDVSGVPGTDGETQG